VTAINIIRQKAAVHLLTDGAAYRPDGVLSYRVQKTFPILHLNAAIAGRGSAFFAPIFVVHASLMATSFDDLKRNCAQIAARTMLEIQDALTAADAGTEFDLTVAGWSESNGPSSFFMCNHDGNGAEVQPWNIVELGAISLAPLDAAIKAELDAAFPNGVHPDEFDPAADGLRVLEIQRKHEVDHGPGAFETTRSVGAFAQLTTITLDAIVMKIIHRWRDEIGQPLGNDCA